MCGVCATHCRSSPQAPAPPPDLGAYTERLNKQLPELDKKIADCDHELATLKVQISRVRPGPQQAALKQKALTILKRRKIYEGQRGGVQTRAFNLEQTQFAVESVKEVTEHVAVSCSDGCMSSTRCVAADHSRCDCTLQVYTTVPP